MLSQKVSPKIDPKFGEHKLVVELIDTIVREVQSGLNCILAGSSSLKDLGTHLVFKVLQDISG